MNHDQGITEIIGAILLIGIIVGAFGVFAAIYIPSVKPTSMPHAKLSMACNETHSSDSTIEFPCVRASFGCHPGDNRTCEKDCEWRDYTSNSQISSDQLSKEIMRCKESCMDPICSDLKRCEDLYICHLGGDTLKVSDIGVLINGNLIETNWEIKKISDGDKFVPIDHLSSTKNLSTGDSLRIRNSYSPVDTVLIRYTLPSGGDITLAQNQFGTDIT